MKLSAFHSMAGSGKRPTPMVTIVCAATILTVCAWWCAYLNTEDGPDWTAIVVITAPVIFLAEIIYLIWKLAESLGAAELAAL